MPATLWRSPIFKSVGLKTTATLGGVGLHHELRPGEKKRDRDDQQLCAGEMIARLRCQRLPLIALLGAAVCVAKPVGAETNIEYGSFNRPLSITTGPDGALWFTENGGNKIARITTAGVITEFPIPTADSNPTGITAGPDGALWFAEASADKIGRITTEGVITEFPITAGSFPTDITTGPDGALWFPEYHAGQIGRINDHGSAYGIRRNHWLSPIHHDGAGWRIVVHRMSIAIVGMRDLQDWPHHDRRCDYRNFAPLAH
jgi:hypothetical protein